MAKGSLTGGFGRDDSLREQFRLRHGSCFATWYQFEESFDRCFRADPLSFVRFAFPWGEPGPLANETGPDEVQEEFLASLGNEVRARAFDGQTPVLPIRICESSGHGTGKSAMGAWPAWWILSTRPYSIGTVSAGTYSQLEEKTWAAVRSWGRLCRTAQWFDVQASGIFHKQHPENWKVTPPDVQSGKRASLCPAARAQLDKLVPVG